MPGAVRLVDHAVAVVVLAVADFLARRGPWLRDGAHGPGLRPVADVVPVPWHTPELVSVQLVAGVEMSGKPSESIDVVAVVVLAVALGLGGQRARPSSGRRPRRRRRGSPQLPTGGEPAAGRGHAEPQHTPSVVAEPPAGGVSPSSGAAVAVVVLAVAGLGRRSGQLGHW